MTTQQKIIRAKVGLLDLAKQLNDIATAANVRLRIWVNREIHWRRPELCCLPSGRTQSWRKRDTNHSLVDSSLDLGRCR